MSMDHPREFGRAFGHGTDVQDRVNRNYNESVAESEGQLAANRAILNSDQFSASEKAALKSARQYVLEYLDNRQSLAGKGIALSQYVCSAMSSGPTQASGPLADALRKLDGLFAVPKNPLLPVR